MIHDARRRKQIDPDCAGVTHPALAPRASAGSSGTPPRGVTLVELMMVFILIGVLVALAAPKIDATDYRMRGAVHEIGTTLLGAQRQAVMEQHNVVVAIDAAGRRLRIHSDEDGDGALDDGEVVRIVALGDEVVFGLGGAPARPMGGSAIEITRVQGGLPAITFHRDGSASEEGGFYITSLRAQRTGAFASDTYAIEIARSTGRAAWYRYTGSQWERRF